MVVFEFINFIFIGIGHILLYLLLIGRRQLKFSSLFIISVMFIVFLTLNIAIFQIVELNMIVLCGFLLLLGLMYKKDRWKHYILFSTLSITVFSVFKSGVFSVVYAIYLSSSVNVYMWTFSVLQMFSTLFVTLVIFLARSFISDIGRYIVMSRWYIPTYIIAIFSTTLLLIINYPTLPWISKLNVMYSYWLGHILVLSVFALLLMLIVSTVLSKERLMEKNEKLHQAQLMDYVKKLEFVQDELTTFRHDYLNLLLSLEQAIQNEDMAQVKQTYYDVLAPTGQMLGQYQVELTKLSKINIPELRSLLRVKLMHAERQHIEVQIDIPNEINEIALPLVTYLRIVSIFIDNAIESSMESPSKLVQVALFKVENTHYCIVKNKYKQQSFEIQKLYEKQFSLKSDNRGIGLFSVQRLIAQFPQATLVTEVDELFFTQILSVKNV